MTQATRGARKAEPGLHGVPNRIYRGRIVEALRRKEAGFRADALGREIHPEFSPHDVPWLESLLEGLERDGLVRVKRGRTLPGSRVVLA
jgi:hypothetical protein